MQHGAEKMIFDADERMIEDGGRLRSGWTEFSVLFWNTDVPSHLHSALTSAAGLRATGTAAQRSQPLKPDRPKPEWF